MTSIINNIFLHWEGSLDFSCCSSSYAVGEVSSSTLVFISSIFTEHSAENADKLYILAPNSQGALHFSYG